MKVLVIASLLAACKAAPGATEPVVLSNRSTAAGAPGARPTCQISGIVRDAGTGETLAGATLVAVPPDVHHRVTAISDEHGRFQLRTQSTHTRLEVYYADSIRNLAIQPCRRVGVIWVRPT